MKNHSSVHFNYFNSRYPPPSFNTPHTMKAMVVVPRKKKKTWWFNAADSLSFLPRTLALYFTAKRFEVSQLRWSCDTLSALKNASKIKLRGVMHTLVFFSRTTCSYAAFGTSTNVPFHRTKRKHSVFKLTLTVDKGLFPRRQGLLLRRRLSSRRGYRRVSAVCEEEMLLQPAPSFHEIKYSELFIFRGCWWTNNCY